MKEGIKIISLSLIVLHFSCLESRNDTIINDLVIYEQGHIHDSFPEELKYFSYQLKIEDSLKKHIYKLDSILYLHDSSLVKGKQLESFEYKKVYFQSLKKDYLFSSYYENDTILKYASSYSLVDSIQFNISNRRFIIYKYEIPNPPMDGDLTCNRKANLQKKWKI